MSDTPTPRTAELMEGWDYSPTVSALADHAEQLERELAEARRISMAWALSAQRCGLYRADVPHSTPEEWQAAQSSAACALLDQLTVHKAALEKCEHALKQSEWHLHPASFAYAALQEIAKLKGTK